MNLLRKINSRTIITGIIIASIVTGGIVGLYYLSSHNLGLPDYKVITDFEGRNVTIPYEVNRVVVLESYDIVYALGQWDKVVGISKYAYSNPILVAADEQYNFNLTDVPSPGSSFSVNIEELVLEDPEVVIAYASSHMQDILPQIEALNISVVLISLDNLDDLYQCIELLGEIFNVSDRASEIITYMKKTMDIPSSKTNDLTIDSKLKMIHLWSSKTKVTGGLGVTNTYIHISGCINPAVDIKEKYAEVSIEEIIAWNPDVIVIWGSAKYTPEDILNDTQWQSISAVQNQKVFKYPKLSTWSPASPLIVLRMGMWAYPDLFTDINFETVSNDLFMNIYGINDPFEWQ